MSAGTPLVSWKTRIFESVPGFLPDRVQITVLALVVLVVVSRAVRTKRRTAHRRATRAGRPVHVAAPHGQDSAAQFGERSRAVLSGLGRARPACIRDAL
ncbi:hypothetical protein [Streptomyces sp. KMM 9044]|uniref:hypothetical protein n=1 Tax=Streptomyces sp. KMM 9044 TaxID=2744474 RepID=UPI0021515CA7|nr:hypothetical protein [Streptomyces sp. KMM 9044]WAX81055.1 hypothetical protein HUV60_028750 [Streptomyces sp. KMM 9044]